MSVRIVNGHPEAHEKLTGRLFWKLRSATGYNDAGNVREYADASTRTLVTRARASDGARHVNDEQVDVNHEAWTFLLDERDPEQEKLLKLARRLDNESQAAADGTTATLEDVEVGKWYPIGMYNIQNVRVNGTLAGLCDEGVDYEIDEENGRLKVIDGGAIAAGEDLTLTFDSPAITLEVYETQYQPLFYCDIIIEEHNQYHKMWLRRRAFAGYLNVTEFPAQTGEFGVFRVKVTPASAVTVRKRPEGQTLTALTETTEQAGQSSSSSSKSSSSSAHSSSSSSS
jgi:hypothetical protein